MSDLEPVGPLTPEAEAVLRTDVAALEERGRYYAGRYDILSLLATLDAERAAGVTLAPRPATVAERIAAVALDPAYEAMLRENDDLRARLAARHAPDAAPERRSLGGEAGNRPPPPPPPDKG